MTATEHGRRLARRALAALARPVDAAGLAAFRIGFGALMLLSTLRFVAKGWISELYLAPSFHFTYLGFEWVRPWPAFGLAVHFSLMALAAVALMLGAWTRLAAFTFFVTFTLAELFDKATYLNHYYLASLVALYFVILDAGAAFSLDARRRGHERKVPAFAYHALRAQLFIVYFYAGVAKLNPDWLFSAQPLGLWLGRFAELPLVGPLVASPATAYAASFAGVAFDLAIVPLLLFRRSRAAAFGVAVAFHGLVGLLFPIGVFSWLMVLTCTVFFEPGWLRFSWRAGPEPAARLEPRVVRGVERVTLAILLAAQLVLPARSLFYPGAASWTEEGFRFAWRVMLNEKTGHVELTVVADTPPRRLRALPDDELTPMQYAMMSIQPDMIHEYALYVAERYRARGHTHVSVYADAWAALNGRPSQRLIDPSVDLATEPRSLAPQRFVLRLRP